MPDELSDDTVDKLKSLKKHAEAIMRVMGVPEDRAWQMMAACNVERVAALAERIDKRQELKIVAEKRSLAAMAATFKAKVEE